MTSMTKTMTNQLIRLQAEAKHTNRILPIFKGDDNCGCRIYELHANGAFARVRLEDGQDVHKLIEVLNDFGSLSCYGRHDLSRVHLFRAVSRNGEVFEFASPYSNVYKIGLLCGLEKVYKNLVRHTNRPVSMSRRFVPKRVLSFDGCLEWSPSDESETYMDVVGNDHVGWDN
jgi:hypothetical protein